MELRMERVARLWLDRANDAYRRQEFHESLACSAIARVYLMMPDDEQPDHVARWEDDGGRWTIAEPLPLTHTAAQLVELGGEG